MDIKTYVAFNMSIFYLYARLQVRNNFSILHTLGMCFINVYLF
jgi:hypothetical protein